MAKTIAINPSWYWPDDVPRLIGVPPFFCDRLMVGRWAKRRPEATALADADATLTYAELDARVSAAAEGVLERAGAERRTSLRGVTGIDGAVEILGALRARVRVLVTDANAVVDEAAGAAQDEAGIAQDEAGAGRAGVGDVHEAAVDLVTPDGWIAGHSHYSLVAGALSVAEFLQLEDGESWLAAMPLWTWEGLYSLIVPLYLGATAVLCGERGADDEIADAVDDHSVAYTILPFEETRNLGARRPRRLADAFKRNLKALMLSADRPFPPGDRRKVKKTLDVPVLTVFGLTETGPILASHPSWYVDESVGIPMTNVEVQPANPTTGEPLDTLWELLDYATMVIRAPLVMAGYEGPAAADEDLSNRLERGWFKTKTLASFDANGMMYLVEG